MTQNQDKLIEFSRALLMYKNDKKKPAMVKYKVAVKVYAKSHIPTLMATQAAWNALFDKF
jgi:hypothetical protein